MRLEELAEHPLGLTWVVDDPLLRASHALVHDGRVWFVDPVDAPEALERARGARRAGRRAAALHGPPARRRGDRGSGSASRCTCSPTCCPTRRSASSNLDLGPWKERALWWPEPRGLVVAESIGTATHYAVGNGPAGTHFVRRFVPPTRLRPFLPEHLLVGHGAPVHGSNAAAALLDAIDRSRRDLPQFVLKAPRLLRGMHARR